MSKPHPYLDYEMRVVLFAGLEEFSLQEARWPAALDLAQEYSWQPAGALPPETDAEDWPGGYAEPFEQRVEHADACRFADALERSLYDLPDAEDWEERWLDMEYPYRHFAGKRGKQTLRELISFCRRSRSGFAITGPVRVQRKEWLFSVEEE
jgi:hypothetical protein